MTSILGMVGVCARSMTSSTYPTGQLVRIKYGDLLGCFYEIERIHFTQNRRENKITTLVGLTMYA